jgi:hypothetical protein
MTNTLAVLFGTIIIAVFAADYFYYDWGLWLIALRRLEQLTEYIAFWH